ncbi:Hpt domain protein [Novipirellula aureliae]|uniref:Hpt domain protein n=1 Tax=Novipirellula aureliae TaxID=2527966 RepID=A0A5C6DKB1_9BACT|nr:Hpt domain-containing protein [Novipirellula aureliae]TWU35319.1 Hpt domain protein [Novipirellula aureliae]
MSLLTQQQRTRFDQALTRVGGDEEMLIVLARMAVEDAPPLMEKLEAQLANQELSGVAKTTHAFKGLLSTFETGTPVEQLQAIMDAAKEGDLKTASGCYRELKPAINELLHQIDQLLAE